MEKDKAIADARRRLATSSEVLAQRLLGRELTNEEKIAGIADAAPEVEQPTHGHG